MSIEELFYVKWLFLLSHCWHRSIQADWLRLVHLKLFCYLMALIDLLFFFPVGKNALHLAARNAQSLCVQKLLQVKLFFTVNTVESRDFFFLLSHTISALLYPLFDVEKYWIISVDMRFSEDCNDEMNFRKDYVHYMYVYVSIVGLRQYKCISMCLSSYFFYYIVNI